MLMRKRWKRWALKRSSWREGLEGLVGRETAERWGVGQKPVVVELER